MSSTQWIVAVIAVTVIASGCDSKLEPSPAEGPGSSDPLVNASELSLSESPHFTVGRLEGDSSEVIGRIADVLFTGSGGRWILADAEMRNIRMYDADVWIDTQGGRGSGPGEYEALADLLLVGEDTIGVIDLRGRTSLLEVDRNEGLEFAGSFRPAGIPRSGCSVAGTIYLLENRPSSSSLVHSYSVDGEEGTGIFPRPDDENDDVPLVASRNTDGQLVCSGTEYLALIPRYGSEIRVATIDGDTLPPISIPDYREMPIRIHADGSVEQGFIEPDVTEVNLLRRAVSLGPSQFLVQIAVITREDVAAGRTGGSSLRSFLVTIPSSEITEVPHDLPEILAASDSLVAVSGGEMFPQVQIHRLAR